MLTNLQWPRTNFLGPRYKLVIVWSFWNLNWTKSPSNFNKRLIVCKECAVTLNQSPRSKVDVITDIWNSIVKCNDLGPNYKSYVKVIADHCANFFCSNLIIFPLNLPYVPYTSPIECLLDKHDCAINWTKFFFLNSV